jgi:TatA/E family protein of Tat protein translocase
MFRNPLTDGVVVLLVLLLFFGPKRLPMLSRSIGESIKEFKGGVASGASDEETPALSSGPTATTADSRPTAEAGAERHS